MKTLPVPLLIATHVLAGIAAWWVVRDHPEADPGPAPVTAQATIPPAVPGSPSPASPNPILRATSADFRAAWRDILRRGRSDSGEPGGNSLSLFVDWCGVDPEGAILGLSELYAPRFAHNYLSHALATHGGALAEPLAKHWQSLRHIPIGKVSFALGGALNDFARTDPARASTLVADLPGHVRRDVYKRLFDGLTTPQLNGLTENMLESVSSAVDERERAGFWEHLARAVDVADPEAGLIRWLERVEDPEGFARFARSAVDRAVRFERWPQLLESAGGMAAGEREQLEEIVVVEAGSRAARDPGWLVPFLEACWANGQWRLAELAGAESRFVGPRPIDPPEVFLDWASSLGGEADDPMRVAVDLALRSDTAATFSWIEGQPAGAARDRVLLAGIARLADGGNPDAALSDWLDLFQGVAARREAEELLGKE